MKELIIKIDDQTYNNFICNKYSRDDVIAMHAALVNGILIHKDHGDLIESKNMDNFSEDNFYRIMTNLSVCSKPISLRRQLSEREVKDLDRAISDVTNMAYMLHNRFASQFNHDPSKRRCCPNDDCHSIYAYFYDDFHYCPKCGTKLEEDE